MIRYATLQMHKIGRQVRNAKFLNKHFPRFKDRVYWAGDRMSFARAGFIGSFCMMLPIPFQMILSSIIAYYARANIPLASALAWITNPFTMGPIWYGGYRFGTWLLNTPNIEIASHNIPIASEQWFSDVFPLIWQPFLVGNLLIGTLLGVFLYSVIAYIHLFNWQKLNPSTDSSQSKR